MMTTELVALGVALIVLALGIAWWTSRRKEGWEFRGGTNLLDESDPTITKHRTHIWRRCRAGMKLSSIKDNEDWDYLAKYDEKDAVAICRAGQEDMVNRTVADSSGCPGNRACPDPALRRTRPCTNKDGSRCCMLKSDGDLFNCIDIDETHDINPDNIQKLRAEKAAAASAPRPAATQSVASGAAPAGKSIRYSGNCYKYDVMQDKVVEVHSNLNVDWGKDAVEGWKNLRYMCNTPVEKKGWDVGNKCAGACEPGKGPLPKTAFFYYKEANTRRYSVVHLYSGDNFDGAYEGIGITGGVRDMMDTKIGNDKLSSVKVPKGLKITLYQKPGGGGHSLTLTQGDHKLAHYSFPGGKNIGQDVCEDNNTGCWNDSASSLKVEFA